MLSFLVCIERLLSFWKEMLLHMNLLICLTRMLSHTLVNFYLLVMKNVSRKLSNHQCLVS